MRFMMMVRANPQTESGTFGAKARQGFEAMARYNEELIKAGVLLGAEGLKPSAEGARVKFTGGRPVVTDGPFSETKELIAGFWLIEVRDRAEALEWARRIPYEDNNEIELRQLYEAHDFPEEVFSKEEADKEQAWRDALQKPVKG
jgi:hypothetical protein